MKSVIWILLICICIIAINYKHEEIIGFLSRNGKNLHNEYLKLKTDSVAHKAALIQQDEENTSYVYPLAKGSYRISSNYGNRIHPIRKIRDFHKGVDLAAPARTAIHCPCEAKVKGIFYNNGYGHFVDIECIGTNIVFRFAHLMQRPGHIKKGGIIKKSSVIGFVGNTGISTGPHLHLEVFLDYPEKIRTCPIYFLEINKAKHIKNESFAFID